jgi:hypothetical protein
LAEKLGATQLLSAVANRPVDRANVSIACAVYLVGYLGYCFGEHMGSLRYIVYLAPIMLAAVVLRTPHARLNRHATNGLLMFLLLAGVGYMATVRNADAFRNEFIILFLIFLGFVPAFEIQWRQLRWVFYVSLVYFFLAYALAKDDGIRLLRILESGSASGLAGGYDSHQGGLLGPIYTVFFFAIGAKAECLLAMAMTVVGGKRIAVVAIIVGIAASVALRRMHPGKRFVFTLVSLAIINILAANTIAIFDEIHARVQQGAHVEEVMLGRHRIGLELNHVIDSRPWLVSLIGNGAGSANALTEIVTKGALVLPHNDWLKILYDYGIIGSLAITFFLARVFACSMIASAVGLASAVIMATDNVFIYLYYQFPIMLMFAFGARLSSEEQPRPVCNSDASLEVGTRSG